MNDATVGLWQIVDTTDNEAGTGMPASGTDYFNGSQRPA
jgi:hypothetical protein